MVLAHKSVTLTNNERANVLNIVNGSVLVISSAGFAIYTSEEKINDPLGNGIIDYCEFENFTLPISNEGNFLNHHSAGYVELNGGYAILITPNTATLYANKNDALHNRNPLAQVSLH